MRLAVCCFEQLARCPLQPQSAHCWLHVSLFGPYHCRGEVRCLGCTSLDKYRKFIEKDPGLERRFQQVRTSQFILLTADANSGMSEMLPGTGCTEWHAWCSAAWTSHIVKDCP